MQNLTGENYNKIMNNFDIGLRPAAIGSMPHKNPEEAFLITDKIFKDIPFWMQLPTKSATESMSMQFSDGMPGVKIENSKIKFNPTSDEFFEKTERLYSDFEEVSAGNTEILKKYAISPDFSCSFDLFLKRIKEQKPKFAKGQITGAFTLGTMICDESGNGIFGDDTYREILTKFLSLKALWQIYEIKKASDSTVPIIFEDEPAVSQAGSSAYLSFGEEDIIAAIKEISDGIRQNGGLSAVHCCGKADWSKILKTGANIINFDIYSFSKHFLTYKNEIAIFLKNGGILAWGIVPTMSTEVVRAENFEKLFKILDENFAELSKTVDLRTIVRQSIITPSCGAGSLDVKSAEKVMALTGEISEAMRQKYGELLK